MSDSLKLLVSIVGPTAVGKTSFAINIAQYFKSEIISVDSRQFYRELEIGTAKPSAKELKSVTHHFINSHSIAENISAGIYEDLVLETLEDLFEKYRVVVAVGGSGLYFKALWEGMDSIPSIDPGIRQELMIELENQGLGNLLKELSTQDPRFFESVDQNNPHRIVRALEVIRGTGKKFSSFQGKKDKSYRPFDNLKIGLTMDREMLYQRIDDRMDQMIEMGLFEEARKFLKFKDHNALQTVGYSEIFKYFDGDYDREEAIRLLKRNSRRYAKRQYTWFRKDPEILWLSPDQTDQCIGLINERLGI
ncbi:MAG: tRNA (adenosine(37)-N6)-dimethylallyltransferase MiaA [Bacteroidota bacterium]